MTDNTPAQTFEIVGADGARYKADLETARRWVAEGRITAGMQVWVASERVWRRAQEVPDLFPATPPVVRPVGVGSSLGYIFVALFIAVGVALLIFAIASLW